AQPNAGVTIQNPNSATTNMQFSNMGCYNISVNIGTPLGCHALVEKDSLVCVGALASFTLSQHACRNQPLTLQNTSRLNPDVFKWKVTPSAGVTFDADTARNPKIRIANQGCYTVTL